MYYIYIYNLYYICNKYYFALICLHGWMLHVLRPDGLAFPSKCFYSSVYIYLSLYIYLFICLYISIYSSVFIYLSIHLSIYRSMCLSLCHSLYLFAFQSLILLRRRRSSENVWIESRERTAIEQDQSSCSNHSGVYWGRSNQGRAVEDTWTLRQGHDVLFSWLWRACSRYICSSILCFLIFMSIGSLSNQYKDVFFCAI